jgi:hypothetical protein
MNRSALAGFALLLIGGLAVLYFVVIKESPAATPQPAQPSGSGARTGVGPTLGSGAAPRPTTIDPTAPKDTTGMVVTDHRTAGDNVVIAPGSDTPPGRRLDPGLVRSIHRNAEAIMVGCAKKVDAADRGARPRIGADLKVAIRDGNLEVTDVTPRLADLGGDQVEAVKSCVHDLMMNFTAPTPDEADLDSYELHYQYVVR